MFNALTRNNVLAENYPFATIEPNTGIVPLPDDRLPVLAKLVHTEKIVPATVTFVDIAGIVKGASEGEGLGNKFLANIREADAICEVVRAFEDDDIVHVNGKRYRRQDAIGTPYCVTVDHDTLKDNCVTLRFRDTMEQERVPISELNSIIEDKVSIASLLKKLQ